jgi:hypothetical protein
MRSWIQVVLAGAVCALAFVGCGGGGEIQPPKTCTLRVAHFAATAPHADFYFKGLIRFENIGYSESGRYIELNSGNVRALADSAGKTGVLADNLGYLTLVGETSYTLYLYHNPTANQDVLGIRADAVSTPAAGKASLRLLHLAQDVPGKVEVLCAGNTWRPGDQGDLSAVYGTVEPGTFPVVVRSRADTTVVYTSGTLTMAAGGSYTMVFSGVHSGGPGYRVTVMSDTAYVASASPARWPAPPTSPRLAVR